MQEFYDVKEFNEKIIKLKQAEFLNEERLKWFETVINEEMSEFKVANKNYIDALNSNKSKEELIKHKVDMIDALIDLLYYVYGRFYEINCKDYEFQCLWSSIQKANMSKVKGNKGRGSDEDAVKPEGWQSPEYTLIELMLSKLKEEK